LAEVEPETGVFAAELGAHFVARRRRHAWLFVIAGVALIVGCFAGFGYFGGKEDALVKNGTRTTATVTSAALYGGRYSRNSFNEHIDVEFAYPGGVARGVRIYIGETDRFRVGQQVEIVYDPSNPHRAALAHGTHDIGPVGFPLFFGIVLGLCFVIIGARSLRLFRSARQALRQEGRTMEADSRLVDWGRARRLAISLRGESGEGATLWSTTKRGWSPLLQPVEATVFGSTAPGSVVVVTDPQRQAVTAGRVWKAPRLVRAPHLPQLSRSLAAGLLALVVAVGLATTAIAVIWNVRLAREWRESARIQAGPQVLATIVSTGKVSAGHEDVTLRYVDRAGASHLLAVRYPLGLASDVIPGMTTTVSYDANAPEKAELAGHQRHRWQTAALAAAATLGLTVLWLAIAVSLRRASDETRAHRGHLFASAGGVIVLIASAARLVLVFVVASTPQEVAFPPHPPPLAPGRAAQLPRILSPAPPATGPLVTPALARRVVHAAWPLRDGALAGRDVATLRELESGPALAVDVARMREGGAPNRPVPDRTAPSRLAVYVPRQTVWPIRFLAEVPTKSAAHPFLEFLIFSRNSAKSSWRVVYDTGFSRTGGAGLSPDPGVFDRRGYDVVPAGEIRADDAIPHLARYWQAWRDDGSAPAAVPPFAPGTWTTDYGQSVSGRQNRVGDNGLPEHIAYGDEPAPAREVWTFGVWGEELVCSPMHQTTTWTGPAHQDPNREKWGSDLAPGVYSSVTAEIVREPCVLVPQAAGALVAFGADRWVVHLRGTKS
jgi:Protein of unknown function (DUF3592)